MIKPARDQQERIARIEQAGWAGDEAAVPGLLCDLGDSDPVIRRLAAAALGQIGSQKAVPALIDALDDPDRSVRLAILRTLEVAGEKRAVSAMAACLRDPDAEVRRAAARALGALVAVRAVPQLRVALTDPDPYVRQAAQHALRRIEAARGADGLLEPPRIDAPPPASATEPPKTAPSQRLRGWPIALGGMAAGAIIVAGLAAWLWRQPLSPHLDLPTPVPLAADTVIVSAEPAPQPVCGGPADLIVLVAGLDGSQAADAIRLVRIDFVHQEVVMLAVPRDLWVPYPALAGAGISENRLKAAYAYGVGHDYPGGGPGLLAATLSEQFGARVDRYLIGGYAAFADGIDAVGGIDLYVAENTGDPGDPLYYFPAGWHHLDGAAALRYAQMRPGNSSDRLRIERQTAVIEAVQARVSDPRIASALPRLIAALRNAVVTDFSPAEIGMLLCLARRLDGEQIVMQDLDPALYTAITDEYGYERLLPDTDAIRAALARFNAGARQ
jgi:LCP family protein required for cell wall assembly